MTVEQQLRQYLPNWVDKPRQQVVAEVASYIHETRRISDPYFFLLTPEGELYSPDHKCVVKKSVLTGHYLGNVELEALEITEKIAQGHDSGLIVWISPRYGDVYPLTKAIYSEIVNRGGRKILLNRAMVYGQLTDAEVLQFARDLAQRVSCNLIPTSLEDVRRRPIYVPAKGACWTYIVGEHLEADEDWKMVRNGEDLKIKERSLAEAEVFYDSVISQPTNQHPQLHSVQAQIFGPHEGPCPSMTAFNMLFKTEAWTGKCPLCGTFNKDLRPGDRCAGCNEVYEGCGTELGPDQPLVINFSQN